MSVHPPQDLQKLQKSCSVLHQVVTELRPMIKEGVTTMDIELEARKLLTKHGSRGSFDQVSGYDFVTCTMINDQIVHTRPSKRVIKSGDVFTLDIGAYVDGFHSDYADTWVIGDSQNAEISRFLKTGKDALAAGIKAFRLGNHIGNISQAIEDVVKDAGYHVIKQLTGHGIGRKLHEEPYVPGFLSESIEDTPAIVDGMALAIEVMYAKGTDQITHEKGDKWSLVTADGSLSAQFEHTVSIIGKKTCILT